MAKRPTKTERRRTILAAARKVFCRNGYEASRMADIAVAAGVGKGTLYEHFQGKEDLFTTLILVVLRESLETLSAATHAEEADVALAQVIDFAVDTALREHLDLYRLFYDFWGVSPASRRRIREPLRSCAASFRELIAGIVRRGQRSGRFRTDLDPEYFARALLAAVDGMSLPLVILADAVELRRYAATLRATFFAAASSGGPLMGASLLRESDRKPTGRYSNRGTSQGDRA